MNCPDCGKKMICGCADGDLIELGGDFADYECEECKLSVEIVRNASFVRMNPCLVCYQKTAVENGRCKICIAKGRKVDPLSENTKYYKAKWMPREEIVSGEVKIESVPFIGTTDMIVLLKNYVGKKVFVKIVEC